MDFKLRNANSSDIKTLDYFQNNIGIHERPLDSNIKRKGKIRYYALKDIKKIISSKNSKILIAEINGKPVGCGFGEIKKNHANWSKFKYKGYIGMMFVEKEYRSKGIGTKILNTLLDWFEKRKVSDIRLQVYSNNDIAVHTYRKSGFKDYLIEMSYRP
jgi:ribosomal protein S18 acetylase RimI-like enzyme